MTSHSKQVIRPIKNDTRESKEKTLGSLLLCLFFGHKDGVLRKNKKNSNYFGM